MNKRSYFLKALRVGAFTEKHWIFNVFSMVKEGPEEYKKNPYPCRLVRTDEGFFYVDPDKNGELSEIDEKEVNQPLFGFKERIILMPGEIANVVTKTDTLYGNALFNQAVLVYAFHDKIPFVTGKIDPVAIEKIIELRFCSDVNPPEKEDPAKIYVHEYLRYTSAVFFLNGINPIAVPSASPKTLTRDPRLPALREKLLAENKDRLHDPSVVARIDAELTKLDKAWVDDYGRDFYIKEKAYSNSRKKLFSMVGFEKGFVDGQAPTLVPRALSEGWSLQHFPAMMNSSREGSFNRGSMTMLGGVAVKEAIRAMQNSKIVPGDCGSKLGMRTLVSKGNAKELLGFYYLNTIGKPILITEENLTPLIGNEIKLRSPMLCKTPYTDFCSVCMGIKNAAYPTGLSSMVASVGSTFMGVFMKKMHISSLKLTNYDHTISMT